MGEWESNHPSGLPAFWPGTPSAPQARSASKFLCLGILAVLITPPPAWADFSEKEQDSIREALRDFNLLVTRWRSTGAYKVKQPAKPPFWEESVEWVWHIAPDAVGIAARFDNGRFFKEGFLTFDLAKRQVLFKATRLPDVSIVYAGPRTSKDEWIVLTGTNPETRRQETVELRLLHSDVYLWNFKDGGKHIAQVRCILPEGFARADSGPKCVVTGGLGTSQVAYQGKTYYVCCSGCAQAFQKNPEKFVREFEAQRSK